MDAAPTKYPASSDRQGIGNKPLLKYVVQYPQLIDGMDPTVRADLADPVDASLLADVVRHLVEEPDMNTGTLIGLFRWSVRLRRFGRSCRGGDPLAQRGHCSRP